MRRCSGQRPGQVPWSPAASGPSTRASFSDSPATAGSESAKPRRSRHNLPGRPKEAGRARRILLGWQREARGAGQGKFPLLPSTSPRSSWLLVVGAAHVCRRRRCERRYTETISFAHHRFSRAAFMHDWHVCQLLPGCSWGSCLFYGAQGVALRLRTRCSSFGIWSWEREADIWKPAKRWTGSGRAKAE